MMEMLRLGLLFLLVATASASVGEAIDSAADTVGDAASDAGSAIGSAAETVAGGVSTAWTESTNWMGKQVNNVQDLFANDKDELEKKVAKVEEFLKGIKEKAGHFLGLAGEEGKKALGKVDENLEKVQKFHKELKESTDEEFAAKKQEWEGMMNKMYDGDDGSIKELAKLASNGALGQLGAARCYFALFSALCAVLVTKIVC